jgi:hypothetical protein
MQKILIDSGELTGQLLVEQAQNIRITLHERSYGVKAVMSNRCRWAGLEPHFAGLSRHSAMPAPNLAQQVRVNAVFGAPSARHAQETIRSLVVDLG